jgi:hypothetical protein
VVAKPGLGTRSSIQRRNWRTASAYRRPGERLGSWTARDDHALALLCPMDRPAGSTVWSSRCEKPISTTPSVDSRIRGLECEGFRLVGLLVDFFHVNIGRGRSHHEWAPLTPLTGTFFLMSDGNFSWGVVAWLRPFLRRSENVRNGLSTMFSLVNFRSWRRGAKRPPSAQQVAKKPHA